MSNLTVFLTTDIVISSTNAASVLVCTVASFLVLHLRLHKVPVYRLALYQVLSSLVFAAIETFQIVSITIKDYPSVNGQECAVFGWFIIYARWVKVIFTIWVTIHVFCFAVLHKNLKRFELLYIATSLLVPVPIASVPLITHSYRITAIGNCFTYSVNSSVGTIEKFSLWYGPIMFILFALSVVMLVMVIVLARRVYRRYKYELIEEDQYWAALKQLLPLSAFPILFLVFVIPVFVVGVLLSIDTKNASISLSYSTLFIALWSMSSGVTLIVHVSIARCLAARKQKRNLADVQKSLSRTSLSQGVWQQGSESGAESCTVFRYSYNSIQD